MAGDAKLQILIKAKDEASKELDKVGRASQDLDKKMRRMGIGMVAAGAAISGALLMTVKSAAQEEKGMIRLRVAAQNVGIAYNEVEASLEQWIFTQQQKTAISDTEQRDALASLVRMTGDLDKAQEMLTLSMDVAVGTGRDLASANTLIMYALGGNWGMLERYIPAIKEAQTQEEKWMLLRKLFKGQAEEFGKSMAGQYQLLKHNISDLKESIGFILMPAVERLVEVLNTWVLMMQKIPKPIQEIGVYVGMLVGGVALLGGALMILYSLHLVRMIKAMWASVASIRAAIVAHVGLKAAIGGLILGAVMAAATIATITWAMRDMKKSLGETTEVTEEQIAADKELLQGFRDTLVTLEDLRTTLQQQAQDWRDVDEQIKAVKTSITELETSLANLESVENDVGGAVNNTTSALARQAKTTGVKISATLKLWGAVVQLDIIEAALAGDISNATRAELEQKKAALETTVAKYTLAEGANAAARAESNLAAATTAATESSRRAQVTAAVVPEARVGQRLAVLTPTEQLRESWRHREELGESARQRLGQQIISMHPAWGTAAWGNILRQHAFTSFEQQVEWVAKSLLGFKYGGFVPGPIGTPVPAVVHGGEMIIPAGGLTVVLQLDGREIARHTIKHVGRMAREAQTV